MEMDSTATNQRWFGSSSAFRSFQYSWILNMAGLAAKQEAETTGLSEYRISTAESSPHSALMEEICHHGRDEIAPSSGYFCSTISPSEVREDYRADLDISEMKRVFQKFDENEDDLICSGDLRRFMSRLGFQLSEDEAISMLATVDHDGDGKVGFQEFCTLDGSLGTGRIACTNADLQTDVDDDEDETLLEAFRVFDKNDDGFITCQDLQTVLLDLGMPEGESLESCELMILGVASDGNCEVDIKDFKRMMSSKSSIY